jgi:hypothetical protein
MWLIFKFKATYGPQHSHPLIQFWLTNNPKMFKLKSRSEKKVYSGNTFGILHILHHQGIGGVGQFMMIIDSHRGIQQIDNMLFNPYPLLMIA